MALSHLLDTTLLRLARARASTGCISDVRLSAGDGTDGSNPICSSGESVANRFPRWGSEAAHIAADFDRIVQSWDANKATWGHQGFGHSADPGADP